MIIRFGFFVISLALFWAIGSSLRDEEIVSNRGTITMAESPIFFFFMLTLWLIIGSFLFMAAVFAKKINLSEIANRDSPKEKSIK